MADVRLTATNPVDSSVVPVACNEKGELLLEQPTLSSDDYVAKAGDTMTGNLHLGDNIILNPDGSAQFANRKIDFYENGSAEFAGDVTFGGNPAAGTADGNKFYSQGGLAISASSGNLFQGFTTGNADPKVKIITDGSATFASTVTAPEVQVDTGKFNDRAVLFTSAYHASNTTSVWTDYRSRRGGTWDTWSVGVRGDRFRINVASGSTTGPDLESYLFDINSDGAAKFAGEISVDRPASSSTSGVRVFGGGVPKSTLYTDGSAEFKGDVIVGSRNKQWMIVESNGLAHLVEQTRAADGVATADLTGKTQYPPLRDIPGELTMVEQQLQAVLEKLRMIPEAGWEVWDGSD